MGRGRAKAKQTKVARELKYSTPPLDFEALQRDMSGQPSEDREDQHDDEEDDHYGWGVSADRADRQ